MSMTDITRAILLAKGYQTYTLAADLGVSRDVAKRLLHGKTPFKISDLILISNRLHVSMGFLFDDPGAIAERERKQAEREEAKNQAKAKKWKPYDFLHTLGGHDLRLSDRDGSRYRAAREQYNRYLVENEGRLSQNDINEIETEALRIAKQYTEVSA